MVSVIVSPYVDGNTLEPVRKWLVRLPAFEIPECTNKRLLDQIFKISTLPGESEQESAHRALMAQDERIESLKIACFGQVDFFKVFTLLDLFHRRKYVHNLPEDLATSCESVGGESYFSRVNGAVWIR